jgi:hypothetical protein
MVQVSLLLFSALHGQVRQLSRRGPTGQVSLGQRRSTGPENTQGANIDKLRLLRRLIRGQKS